MSEAFNEQVLPQVQSTFRAGQGRVPGKVWNVPAERPEYRSEEAFKFRSSSRDEVPRNLIRDEDEEDTQYISIRFE